MQQCKYDPAHAALSWAGVRFLLQIARNAIADFNFVIEGREMISRMISRYAIYGDLYLCRASYQAKDELQACLVQLYAAMLGNLSHAQKYYQQRSYKRIIKSALITKDAFEVLLESIRILETSLDRYTTVI
jgi:hypothetical protein